MNDVTDSWTTFAEAEGAEYLAAYSTIWHCPKCRTVAGVDEDDVEWVIETEEAIEE
ncbi:MAG TPA: hypothetical protein VFA78_06715 [Chloroflexota bacterium]|nr:hypothetical protein [Chloroflexota bacterium]